MRQRIDDLAFLLHDSQIVRRPWAEGGTDDICGGVLGFARVADDADDDRDQTIGGIKALFRYATKYPRII
jgi:hypothetical protein